MKKNLINLNQLPLPFLSAQAGGQGRTRAISISHDDRVKTFWFLASACLFSLVVYVYAVNATAHHVAERATLEREASDLNAELATLEFRAIALKNNVTLDVAHQYGFTETAEPLYVARKGSDSLSFNTAKP